MTTSISERANAYRGALRQGINDGLSIQVATMAAKKAARDVGNTPQQDPNVVWEDFGFGPKPCIKQPKPVVLTDAELRLIDQNELTAAECDRLDELELAELKAEEDALDATLPNHRSIANGNTPLINTENGNSPVALNNVEEVFNTLSQLRKVFEDHTGPCLSEELERELDEDGNFCANCGIPHQIHGDECGQDTTPEDHMTDALGPTCASDPGADAIDALSENDGTVEFIQDIRAHEAREELCGVMLVAPKHIQLTINARRIAKQEGNCEDGYDEPECKEPCCVNARKWAKRRAMGAEKKLADAWRDGVGVVTPAGLRLTGLAALMGGVDAENGAEDAGPTAVEVKPRDCDIPATLRAVDIPSTGFNDSIQRWFDGDDEMQQFLAGRCLYADADRSIKDEEGNHVGMWFYAHFGPTPVS